MVYSGDYCWHCSYLKNTKGEIGQIVEMCFDYIKNNEIDDEERHKIVNELGKISASQMPSIVVNNSGSVWAIRDNKIQILPHV